MGLKILMRGQFHSPGKADLSMPGPSKKPIALLKSRWNQLSDLERANEIETIQRSGISRRKIAAGLDRSESLLRHLLFCLQASEEDQNLARRGQISTSELSRRGRAAKKRRAEAPPEIVEAPRPKSADEGADLICDWILKEPLYTPNRVQIIEHVLDEKLAMQWRRSRPVLPDHASLPLTELIQRCEPNTPLEETRDPIDRNLKLLTEYTKWLDHRSSFAFEDPAVRDSALKQAHKRLSGK
jgi:hypothetical protein